MNSEWRPCLRPLRRELDLPEAARGPVPFCALPRLISARRAFFSASVRGVSIGFSLETFGAKTRTPHRVRAFESDRSTLISR